MSDGKHNPFPAFDIDRTPLSIDRRDDVFFEEAMAHYPDASTQSARSFIGSVIDTRRFRIAMGILLLIAVVFVSKTGMMQIVHGEEFRLLAEENRIYRQILPAKRGVIYDRNGVVLAENIPTFQIVTAYSALPSDAYTRQQALGTLAGLIGKDVREWLVLLDDIEDPDEPVLLAKDVGYDMAMYLTTHQDDFPWMQLEISSKRKYITDGIPSLSHVLGYTGVINEDEYEVLSQDGYRPFDHVGKLGLESEYETMLRGTFGETYLEVDALGVTERIISKVDPIDGEPLYLTIDAALQAQIEQVLDSRLDGTVASRASVVAMDPNNGDILALVSWPAYDANAFTDGIDEELYTSLLADDDQPLFARATSGDFPSGSTIKPTHAAAALMEGIIDRTTSFVSTGGICVSIWCFPDWRPGGHGVTDVYWAIADSVNTFFYMIGGGNETFKGLGIEKMMAYDAQMGFGSPTGIDLPTEASGFLPSREWKWENKGEQWYIGDTYHVAIGQGDFLATPLQINRATAMFANGGELVRPRLWAQREIEQERAVDEDVATIIRDAMRYTVTDGSARMLQSAPVDVAGKTGTAQWSTTESPHSWFTGFAPFDDPELAITVLIEEGGDDYLAVPVALDIMKWTFSDRFPQE